MKYAEYINEHYKTIDVLAKNGYYTQAAIEYFVNSYTRLSLPKQKPHENNIGLFRFVAAYSVRTNLKINFPVYVPLTASSSQGW